MYPNSKSRKSRLMSNFELRLRWCRNLKPIYRNSVLDPALAHSMMEYCPKLFMQLTCKWWYSPNGHVAKVPGKGDKSRPLAVFFQVVLSRSFSEGLCGRSGLSFTM